MRTRFVLLAALLLLSLGLTAGAHVAVTGQREAVTLEETVLEGDPADAAGVAVTLRTECLDRLFWETGLVVGPEGTCGTEYTYRPNGTRYSGWRAARGIRMDFWGQCGPTREDETEDEYGMQRPFNDVASRCPAGTANYTERVDLSDYYDDFPIYVQSVDIFTEGVSIVTEVESLEEQVQRELRRCFPIAVPEGTYVDITVDRERDGRAHGWGLSGLDDLSWPELTSVVTEAGCYFALRPALGDGGAALDTSRFPLGYGVYLLPVHLEDAANGGGGLRAARVGAITKVCPIDPGADWVELHASADGSLLYLLVQRGGEAVLTVLDAADGREVDAVPLFTDVETGVEGPVRSVTGNAADDVPNSVTLRGEAYAGDLIVREDFLVPYLPGGRFAVVTWAGEDYGVALTGSFENIQRNDWGLTQDDWWYEGLPAVDFNGERLAVADLQSSRSSGFFLAVYGREGPVLLASYVSSQDGDGGGYGSRVAPTETEPLTVALPR